MSGKKIKLNIKFSKPTKTKGAMSKEINSPCCEGVKMPLMDDIRKHIVKGKVMEGRFYFYKCTCGQQWTTDKTDDESLKNFKHKKL